MEALNRNARPILFAGFLLLVCGCGEEATTAVSGPSPIPEPRLVQFSGGFYESDGFYYWDGLPPAGDLELATIENAVAGGMAPRFGTQGWVEGEFDTDGDQYKIDLEYDGNHPTYGAYLHRA